MSENFDSTPEAKWKHLASIDKECFACGAENSHGLKMRFESNGRQIRSKLVIEKTFRGWSNLIHGGILSTMLDETMSWTVINFTGKFMLTQSMNVTFKKPVRVGAALTVTGYIKEQSSERKAVAVAEIEDEDGDLCAVSEGKFALFSKKHFLRMGIMLEEEIEEMASALEPCK
jgi:uncharacterized protein (TIGR00369 family)